MTQIIIKGKARKLNEKFCSRKTYSNKTGLFKNHFLRYEIMSIYNLSLVETVVI